MRLVQDCIAAFPILPSAMRKKTANLDTLYSIIAFSSTAPMSSMFSAMMRSIRSSTKDTSYLMNSTASALTKGMCAEFISPGCELHSKTTEVTAFTQATL